MRELLAAGDARDKRHNVLRVLALEEGRGHRALTGAADADRVPDALRRDLPDVVEVRAGDAAGVHGGEAVAAGARLAEDGLAVPDGARVGLPGELRRAAATLLAARDHRRRNRDAEPDVDDRYHDPEEPAPAREVGLAGL